MGDEKDAHEFLRKVLGENRVTVQIKDSLADLAGKLGLQGDPSGLHFSDAQADGTLKHLVGLALGAPGSTKYHEAAHGLMRELDNLGDTGREVKRVLHQLADTPWMRKQLAEKLKNEPNALEQLKDPEEAVAHMFEQYLADPENFALRPKAESIFQKIKDWIATVSGVLRNDQRGKLIMDAFANGQLADKFDSSGAMRRELLDVGTGKPIVKTAAELTQGLRDTAKRIGLDGHSWLKDTGVPALRSVAEALHTVAGEEEGNGLGFHQGLERTLGQWGNAINLALHGADAEALEKAGRFLQGGEVKGGIDGKAKDVVDAWRKLAPQILRQYRKAGIDIGDLGPNYFPRVWDMTKIENDRTGFIDALRRAGVAQDVAETAANSILHGGDVSPDSDLRIPAFDSRKERVLPRDLPYAVIKNYLQEDAGATMQAYVRQAARRLEYAKRFGPNGEWLENAFSAAYQQGATKEEIAQAKQVVDGQLGNGGAIDPRWQKVNSWAIATANVSLLSLNFLNSLIDPLGLAIRSGNMDEAWAGFRDGFKDMKKWLKEDPALFTDADREAMLFGTVLAGDSATGSVSDVDGGAKKVNDALFKYNLVEGWTKTQRVLATQGAFKFIEAHLGKSGEQSQRFMRELNLTEKDVQRTKEGYIIRDPSNEKLTDAVHRYVDSCVLKPNRSMRPAWANDPHFAVLWHLKSFSYAFDKVFNNRAVYEAGQGNYAPMKVLATFMPVAMASYWMKLMVQGGGELPNFAKAWDTLDWIKVGMQRAGYAGRSGLWTDAVSDPVYAAGPVVNLTAKALGGGGSSKPMDMGDE